MNHPVHTASESAERLLRRSRLVLLSSLLISTSCGDGEASGSKGSLGIWRLSDEPSVVIGGADEREGYLLHQVVGATRLSDGRIVDRQRKQSATAVLRSGGGAPFRCRGRGRRPRRVPDVLPAAHSHSRGLGPGTFLAVGHYSIRARWPVRKLESIRVATAWRLQTPHRGWPTPASRWFDPAAILGICWSQCRPRGMPATQPGAATGDSRAIRPHNRASPTRSPSCRGLNGSTISRASMHTRRAWSTGSRATASISATPGRTSYSR